MGRTITLVIMVALAVNVTFALEDGRIGVLYISDPVRAPGFNFMRAEPIFSLGFVAASLRGFGGWELDDVRRSIRLYFPRGYEDLVTRFDVIVLDNANRNVLTVAQVDLLARAVRELQKGLLMTGGWESFGGTSHGPPWGETSVGRLLPTEDVENTWVESGRVVIDDWENEFISSIPWDRKSPFMSSWHHNLVSVKPGGQLLAHADRNTYPPEFSGGEHPLLVTWEIPEGARVFACTGELSLIAIYTGYRGVIYIPWEYYGDFSSNLMIYLSKRPVPQDVDLVHTARSSAFEAMARTSLLISLIEFIESFGANTIEMMRKVDGINDDMAGARAAYIDLRFDEVLEAYHEIGQILDDLEEEAIELKERTLLWVYIIEWLAVCGTSLVAGFILWSVMVRRRLYREIGVTRLVDG